MRSIDPRVRAHLGPARAQLLLIMVAGTVQTALLVAQAFVLAGSIVAVVEHDPVRSWALALALVVVLRALVGLAGDGAAAWAARATAFEPAR